MALPIRTTAEDVDAICGYLIAKPTGATSAEAKAVIDGGVLDGRKMTAYRSWGLVEDASGRMKITARGRLWTKDKGAKKREAARQIINSVAPYRSVLERAYHSREFVVSATDIAAQWHEHFNADASDNDRILNDQAVCFFQLAMAAGLGELVVGRRGAPTRFEFIEEELSSCLDSKVEIPVDEVHEAPPEAIGDIDGVGAHSSDAVKVQKPVEGNRVFITHGKNKKILEQVKELVVFGKFEPVIAQERETAAKPVPEKVMDDMRTCRAAVIHVDVERMLLDEKGIQVPQINGNVLIEIGAAMALYGRNFILLVEEGVALPSNLQGLYECRYKGDELNMVATMKLLKAFNDFN